MTGASDDARRLFVRENALADDVKRGFTDPSLGSPSLLAVTTTLNAYPTTAQCYYACVPLTLLGNEVEGGPGVVTPGGETFFALNIGSTVPPSGTQVLTTFVGNRWVFRYDA
jgi:hypothetical protein